MKHLKAKVTVLFTALISFFILTSCEKEVKAESANYYLTEGGLKKGIALKRKNLKSDKNNSHLRFELGLMLVYRAFEEMYQTFHSYGINERIADDLGKWTQSKPSNPHPVKYEELVEVFDTFYAKLDEAQEILSKARDLKEPVPLNIGDVRLDLNGNGKLEKSESFEMIFGEIMGDEISSKLDSTVIKFDQGDVTWLEGYCHVAMGLQDIIFNYDLSFGFNYVGDNFFENIEKDKSKVFNDIIEQIGSGRLIKSHTHFKKAISLSRTSWNYYLAETDDDSEWVPNPKQTPLFTSLAINQEMVDGWLGMLDELELITDGKKLIPLDYRSTKKGYGFNVKRFFYETSDLDLDDWGGNMVKEYTEKGTLTKEDYWRNLGRLFPGDNGIFALWLN